MGQKSLDLLPEGDEMRCEPAIALGGAYWALGDVKRSEESFGASRAAALMVSNTLAVPSTCYMGIQQVKQGRLQDALSTFRQGLRLATLPDGTETPVAGFANVKLGGVMLERNDLDSASHYLNRGVEQCVLLGQPDVLTDAYACLGRYQLAIGDLERTHETIQKADQVSQRAKVDAFVLCWLDEVRLKAWLAENNLEAAILWAQKSGLNLFEPFNYLHDLHHQNLARVLVTQGIVTGSKDVQEQAAALLARLQTAAEKAGWLQEQIKFLLMQAVNDHWRGKPEAALQSLTRALLLAEPGRYVLFFLEEGEIARGLLVGLANILRNGQSINGEKLGITLQEEQISCLRKYISMLLSAFEGFSKKKQQKDTYPTHSGQVDFGPAGYQTLSSLIVEQLSGRELEVLKLLAQGCSDKKIAESLVIARGTVHKHLKNIYSKLDVHSRSEAIVRARDSGLL
jgi:LuxR family maltose regulon positive regulatory protein